MKLLYLIPGNVREGGFGVEEMKRRERVLREYASPGTEVDAADVASGPPSIESMYEEALAVPGLVNAAVQAEKDGYDGIVIGCYGDPGLAAVREMAGIPVVGPGETSVLLAAMLGHHFSIVTVTDSIVGALEQLALAAGADRKLASVRPINVPVLDIGTHPEIVWERALAEAKAARDSDRADCIALGCMSMAFAGFDRKLSAELGIPVVNPAVCALKALEGLVSMGLSHSKRAYQTPPKLRGKP